MCEGNTQPGQFDWIENDTVGYPRPDGETDPTGRTHNQPGAKLDKGKIRYSLVFGSMPDALRAVVDVAEYGAAKYSEDGWKHVPEGPRRYTDAMLRHVMAELSGEKFDPDSDLYHAAQTAWNALARLQLILDHEAITTPQVVPGTASESDPHLEQMRVRQKEQEQKRVAIDRLTGIFRQLKKEQVIPLWANWITSDDDGLISLHSDAPEAGNSDEGKFWFSEGKRLVVDRFKTYPEAYRGLSAAWEFGFPGGSSES